MAEVDERQTERMERREKSSGIYRLVSDRVLLVQTLQVSANPGTASQQLKDSGLIRIMCGLIRLMRGREEEAL